MSLAKPVTIEPLEEFRLSDALIRFEGGDRAPLSIFVTEFKLGEGPPLHVHPYPEVFLIESGAVTFITDQESFNVEAGNIVSVAANTKHRFQGNSEETNRVISVHPSGQVVQENLE